MEFKKKFDLAATDSPFVAATMNSQETVNPMASAVFKPLVPTLDAQA